MENFSTPYLKVIINGKVFLVKLEKPKYAKLF